MPLFVILNEHKTYYQKKEIEEEEDFVLLKKLFQKKYFKVEFIVCGDFPIWLSMVVLSLKDTEEDCRSLFSN